MKTIKQTGLAVPSKRLRSCDAAQENYRANLSDDFNQLYLWPSLSLFNYCDFLSFYCGFPKCVCTLQMLCLLQQKESKQTSKKTKPKVQPQSWKLHIRSRDGQTPVPSPVFRREKANKGRASVALPVTLPAQPEPGRGHTHPGRAAPARAALSPRSLAAAHTGQDSQAASPQERARGEGKISFFQTSVSVSNIKIKNNTESFTTLFRSKMEMGTEKPHFWFLWRSVALWCESTCQRGCHSHVQVSCIAKLKN